MDKEKPPKYKLYICTGCGTSSVGEGCHVGKCTKEDFDTYDIPRKNRRLVTCPICGLEGQGRLFQHYHWSSCKLG